MDRLPLELILNILGYLSDRDIYNYLHTCKRCYLNYRSFYTDIILKYRCQAQIELINHLMVIYRTRPEIINERLTRKLDSYYYRDLILSNFPGAYYTQKIRDEYIDILKEYGYRQPESINDAINIIQPILERLEQTLDCAFYDGPFYQVLSCNKILHNFCAYDREKVTYRDILDGFYIVEKIDSPINRYTVLKNITFEDNIPRFHLPGSKEYFRCSKRKLLTAPPPPFTD